MGLIRDIKEQGRWRKIPNKKEVKTNKIPINKITPPPQRLTFLRLRFKKSTRTSLHWQQIIFWHYLRGSSLRSQWGNNISEKLSGLPVSQPLDKNYIQSCNGVFGLVLWDSCWEFCFSQSCSSLSAWDGIAHVTQSSDDDKAATI